MRMRVVSNLAAVGIDISKADGSEQMFTDDGAQLVSISITGTSPVAAILGAFSAIMSAITASNADRTLYVYPVDIRTGLAVHKFTMLVGISGIKDLRSLIGDLPSNLIDVATPEVIKAPMNTPVQVTIPLPATGPTTDPEA